MKTNEMILFSFSLRSILKMTFTLLAVIILAGCQPRWNIDNPYAEVDWSSHGRYKANFHTHTTRSDGRMNPQTVVDKYHELGYQILAITDHNEVTYPWTGFEEMEASTGSYQRLENGQLEETEIRYLNRNPNDMGIIAIESNELSRHHHMGSYFNDHNGTVTEEESLDATAAKNGLVMFNHPGRYTSSNQEKYTTGWYTNLLERYSHIIGVEIYNQGDRYPNDRVLYDDILSHMMPSRKVWAYSNDDMHHSSTLGRNWNVMILPELSEDWVRKGMEEGRSYFVYSPGGHKANQLPEIHQISVDHRKGTIGLNVTGFDSIRWISAGKIIHRGPELSLDEQAGIENYVRAEIFGPGNTVTGTQPFGIRQSAK